MKSISGRNRREPFAWFALAVGSQIRPCSLKEKNIIVSSSLNAQVPTPELSTADDIYIKRLMRNRRHIWRVLQPLVSLHFRITNHLNVDGEKMFQKTKLIHPGCPYRNINSIDRQTNRQRRRCVIFQGKLQIVQSTDDQEPNFLPFYSN